MGFGVIGYIWALLGCASVVFLGFGIGGVLYVVGRFAERNRPHPTVHTIALSKDAEPLSRSLEARSAGSEAERVQSKPHADEPLES